MRESVKNLRSFRRKKVQRPTKTLETVDDTKSANDGTKDANSERIPNSGTESRSITIEGDKGGRC